MKMDSNTILITGGTSGIGFQLATRLLELGNTVIITGRDKSKLDLAQKKLPKVYTFQSDASDPKEISKLYENVVSQFPKLNFLINNAGIMRKINIHDKEMDLEDINREVVINLSGPILMVKQFLPHLKNQKSAAIMNVSSGLAFIPLPISPIYCATKAGVHSFTQSLRIQLKDTSVKVFELAPPGTKTPLMNSFEASDMGGAPMDVVKMVDVVIKGLKTDRSEIRPGISNVLKVMSRLAPNFMFKQLSKPIDNMLAKTKE